VTPDPLAGRRDIWRGRALRGTTAQTVATGFGALDDALPGGGWPLGALTELLVGHGDPGILWSLVPALAALSRRSQWLAWVAPPMIPYAPALAGGGIDLDKILLIHPRARHDALWTIEQTLRSGTCSAVLCWLSGPDHATLRRLQLAAESGNAFGVCFRPDGNAGRHTGAALRLRIRPLATDGGVLIDLLKCRGGRPRQGIRLGPEDFAWLGKR
jgi:hypothetical protein